MFEESLVESRGLVASGTARWTVLGSTGLQFGLAALLIAIPLLHPERLPLLVEAPKLVLPLPPPPKPPPVRVQPAAKPTATMDVPASATAPAASGQRLVLPRPGEGDGNVPTLVTGINMGGGGLGPLSAIGAGTAPVVTAARPRSATPFKVSSGVVAGMLLTPLRPVYPAIAKAAHLEGAVVMEATISKIGKIESLRAVSGPEMLRGAALDAVAGARYKPYLFNGEATEVQTTITVVFRLGS